MDGDSIVTSHSDSGCYSDRMEASEGYHSTGNFIDPCNTCTSQSLCQKIEKGAVLLPVLYCSELLYKEENLHVRMMNILGNHLIRKTIVTATDTFSQRVLYCTIDSHIRMDN